MSNSNYTGREEQIVPGALRGYRSWALVSDEKLKACNWDYFWTPGRNEAVCLRSMDPFLGCTCPDCRMIREQYWHPHTKPPSSPCECGIYGKHSPGNYDNRGLIGGSIKAYGRVFLGTLGFRAQYAEIESLFVLYTSFDNESVDRVCRLAAATAETYQVPFFKTQEEMLEQFPPISVNELLPPEDPELKGEISVTSRSMVYRTGSTITVFDANGKQWIIPVGSGRITF